MHCRDDKCLQNFGRNLKGRDHFEDLGGGWEVNITVDLREMWWEDVDWTHLAQDRDQQ
jgi:hypothetical protein